MHPIQSLLRDIETGDLRLPQLPRDYTWSEQDVVVLLDSLLRGFPVGTIVTWRPAPGTRCPVPERPMASSGATSTTTYLLDGQQRLLSLAQARSGDLRLWYRLTDSDSLPNFLAMKTPSALPRTAAWARVDEVLASEYLSEEQANAVDAAGLLPTQTAESRRVRHDVEARVIRLRQVYTTYLTVEALEDAPYEDAVEVLIRRNGRGRTLTLAEHHSAFRADFDRELDRRISWLQSCSAATGTSAECGRS